MTPHASFRIDSLRATIAGLALVALAQAASAQVTDTLAGGGVSTLPNTPAGKVMAAWITAINSADPAKIQAFVDAHWTGAATVDAWVSRGRTTGGYDVRKIMMASDTRIQILGHKRAEPRAFNVIGIELEGGTEKFSRLLLGSGTAAAEAAGLMSPPAAITLSAAQLDAAKSGAAYKQFSAWLEAFNSGDKARIQKFIDANWPTGMIDGQMGFRERSGGFELLALETATATTLIGTMKEKSGDRYARFTLAIEATAPNKIVRLGLAQIPKP